MILPQIAPLDRTDEPVYRALVDGKAKPLGALGRLEGLAVQLALIAGRPDPVAERCRLMIFAGDHGLTASGVSSYPSEVTAAMVATFLAGRATANAFAAAVGAEVQVIDAGVAADLPPHPSLVDAKIRKGSRNAAEEPALTPDEVRQALSRGVEIALAAAEKADVLAIGEMGIGNTASAALVVHRLAFAALEECVGVGAGHDAAGLARKIEVLSRAAARSAATEPLDVLAEFGGLEIAMMAGAVLGAAQARRPVLIDGFIASAAALAAVQLAPAARDYCIFAHWSTERGHALLLEAVGATPLLSLDMRLGEGSGALLAAPLLRAATRLLTDVASLDDVLAGRL